jgi:hypothetical protein
MDSVRVFVLGYHKRSQSPNVLKMLYFDTSDLNNLPIIVSYSFTFYVICAFTYHILESNIVLLDIRSLV